MSGEETAISAETFEGGSYGSLPGRGYDPMAQGGHAGDGNLAEAMQDAPPAQPAPAPAPAAAPQPKIKQEPSDELIEQEAREPSDVPVVLDIPSYLDAKTMTPEREQYVAAFERMAPESGLDQQTAQGILNVVADAATALNYQIDHEYITADEARVEMTRLYGEAKGSALVKSAQAFYQTLSPEMQEYLDNTGLGSDPACLTAMALAKAGWLALSPVQAQATIKRIMTTKEYMAGGKLEQIQIHLLSRIANREPAPTGPTTGGGIRHQAQQASVQAKAEAAKSELAQLAAKRNLTPEDRARWATLVVEASR